MRGCNEGNPCSKGFICVKGGRCEQSCQIDQHCTQGTYFKHKSVSKDFRFYSI